MTIHEHGELCLTSDGVVNSAEFDDHKLQSKVELDYGSSASSVVDINN